MANLTLVSDFSNWALENYKIDDFINAQIRCKEHLDFYISEIKDGRTIGNQEKKDYWEQEFLKWTPIIDKAEQRDSQREKAEQEKWNKIFGRQ